MLVRTDPSFSGAQVKACLRSANSSASCERSRRRRPRDLHPRGHLGVGCRLPSSSLLLQDGLMQCHAGQRVRQSFRFDVFGRVDGMKMIQPASRPGHASHSPNYSISPLQTYWSRPQNLFFLSKICLQSRRLISRGDIRCMSLSCQPFSDLQILMVKRELKKQRPVGGAVPHS